MFPEPDVTHFHMAYRVVVVIRHTENIFSAQNQTFFICNQQFCMRISHFKLIFNGCFAYLTVLNREVPLNEAICFLKKKCCTTVVFYGLFIVDYRAKHKIGNQLFFFLWSTKTLPFQDVEAQSLNFPNVSLISPYS